MSKREFRFRHFDANVFSALGVAAKDAVDRFAKLRAARYSTSVSSARHKIHQSIDIASHSANVKMLECCSPQLHTPGAIPDTVPKLSLTA